MSYPLVSFFIIFSSLTVGALEIPHYDLEMSSAEYSKAIANTQILNIEQIKDQKLQDIITAGTRNLEWLKVINEKRDSAHKLSLTSAQTQRGIPITDPNIYNRNIVVESFSKLMDQVPAEIKDAVLGSAPLPATLLISDETYIENCRKIDRSYQSASRWILMVPYLSQLKLLASKDVRGFYNLSHVPDVQKLLENWNFLGQEAKKEFTEDLIQICANNGSSRGQCSSELQIQINNKTVNTFYNEYIQGAKEHYEYYFKLQTARSDVTWQKKPEEMHVPFHDPQDVAIKNFLKDNIQDEWKWTNFQLLLDFTSDSFLVPKITFQPGVTAHVNGIAGNTITMDSNVPLTEYDLLWTIRHEYGHVLGFLDCYLEFYDESHQAIMNYQLDITNLMCSRRGHLQEIHYNELKRVYAR